MTFQSPFADFPGTALRAKEGFVAITPLGEALTPLLARRVGTETIVRLVPMGIRSGYCPWRFTKRHGQSSAIHINGAVLKKIWWS